MKKASELWHLWGLAMLPVCGASTVQNMAAQLGDDGWQVLALIYDGCVVRDRSGCAIDLARLEARVHQETGLRMIIEEKELFDAQPRLVLSRSFD